MLNQVLNTCLDLTTMPSQTRRQLLAELVNAGLDDNKLDVIQHELEMDPEADQDESDDVEMLDLDDDGNCSIATSSTICDSHPPTTSQSLAAPAPTKPSVPVKRKCGTRKKTSPEFIIPHCVTQALPLTSKTDHSHMIKNATKGKTPVLTVKMIVIQKVTHIHDSMHFLVHFSLKA